MNRLIYPLISLLFLSLFSCKKEPDNSSSSTSSTSCGYYTFSDKTTTPVYKGSNDGCYYINSNNNKSYVDAKYCCN